MRTISILLMLAFSLLLNGCGFHQRGHDAFELPFKTLYIQAASTYTPFIAELKRTIQGAGAQIVESSDDADLTLQIISESMDKKILSLSGAGRVREYQLHYAVSFRAYDRAQQEWMAPAEITLQRSFSYDDAQVLAKEREEILLQEHVRSDAVQQLLHRLNRARPPQSSP